MPAETLFDPHFAFSEYENLRSQIGWLSQNLYFGNRQTTKSQKLNLFEAQDFGWLTER